MNSLKVIALVSFSITAAVGCTDERRGRRDTGVMLFDSGTGTDSSVRDTGTRDTNVGRDTSVPTSCSPLSLGSRVGSNVASGTLSGSDVFLPSCGSSSDGVDVAYSWSAPRTGNYTFTTDGSDFDTILAIAETCGPTELSCNDDGGDGSQSSLSYELSAGDSIVIVITGYSGATGAYVLNIQDLAE